MRGYNFTYWSSVPSIVWRTEVLLKPLYTIDWMNWWENLFVIHSWHSLLKEVFYFVSTAYSYKINYLKQEYTPHMHSKRSIFKISVTKSKYLSYVFDLDLCHLIMFLNELDLVARFSPALWTTKPNAWWEFKFLINWDLLQVSPLLWY